MSQSSTEQEKRTFGPLSTRTSWRFCLAWVAFFLLNGVTHAAPSPPAEQIVLENFESYRDTSDLREKQ